MDGPRHRVAWATGTRPHGHGAPGRIGPASGGMRAIITYGAAMPRGRGVPLPLGVGSSSGVCLLHDLAPLPLRRATISSAPH